MRIATGSFTHESSTFTTVETTRDSFHTQRFGYLRGGEVLERFDGTNSAAGGFLAGCREHGYELIPTIYAGAAPSAPSSTRSSATCSRASRRRGPWTASSSTSTAPWWPPSAGWWERPIIAQFDPPRALGEPMGDPDLRLLPLLEAVLKDRDPEARPMPMLMVGATDGREFRRLGIQTYGFLPLDLPEEIEVFRLIHADDERVPARCLEFGTRCIHDVLLRFDVVDGP